MGSASTIIPDDGNGIIITGDERTRDAVFGDMLAQSASVSEPHFGSDAANNNASNADNRSHAIISGMLFGIDLRGGAIREMMNGRYETAPTLQAANGLVIRLMGTMMARYNVLENANADDIHLVEPSIRDVTIMVDDVKPMASDEDAFRGVMCMRRIGEAVGFHVILGCSDAEWMAYVMKHKALPPAPSQSITV